MNNENGITIQDLKKFMCALPNEDSYGEPYEVWVTNDKGTTNVITQLDYFNKRKDGTDILLSIGDVT